MNPDWASKDPVCGGGHSVVGEGTPMSHANLASYWMCVWSSTVIFHWDLWGNHKTKTVALACLALYIHFLLCSTSLHNGWEAWLLPFPLLFAFLMSRIVIWRVTLSIHRSTSLHSCFHIKHCTKKNSSHACRAEKQWHGSKMDTVWFIWLFSTRCFV